MKKPDGTADLIGGGIQLLNNVIGLVNDFAPDKDTRAQNRKNRKVKVAIRQLKGRFKTSPVEPYVRVNFSNLPEEEVINLIAYIRGVIGRI